VKVSTTNLKKFKRKLKKTLDENRYVHTMGVMYTAACLAMRYECDISKAQTAGILHDCAKCIPDDTKVQLCRKYNIHMTDLEKSNPFLLHAKLGAFFAMHKYKVTDKEVISAILNHTTGKPDMSLLDKIIYVADYIEPGREKAPNLSEIRKLAFIDIDRAVYRILDDTLAYLEHSDGDIEPLTRKAYEYYRDYYNNLENHDLNGSADLKSAEHE